MVQQQETIRCRCSEVIPIRNSIQFRSSGDRHQPRLLPWSLPTESEQNRLLLCFVPPRSDAVRNLVPRFDRARNLTLGLLMSSLAFGLEPAWRCSLSVPGAARLWHRRCVGPMRDVLSPTTHQAPITLVVTLSLACLPRPTAAIPPTARGTRRTPRGKAAVWLVEVELSQAFTRLPSGRWNRTESGVYRDW